MSDDEPIGIFLNVPKTGPALPDPLQGVDFQKRIEQIRQLKAQLKEHPHVSSRNQNPRR